MRIKVKVHSHDTALPEHDQVQFHTPDHPGGLLVLRLPKGSPLPPIGSEYFADFGTLEDRDAEFRKHALELDEKYELGRQHERSEARGGSPLPLSKDGKPADRTADTLGALEDQPTGDGPSDTPPADNAHVADGAERFDDTHGTGSDQGGA